MAELSNKRSAFYKQVYFPATYYKEVFQLTQEEAQTIREERQQLEKLLIDADTNLSRLSETFRNRSLSPSQEVALRADEAIILREQTLRERRAAGQRELGANPAAGIPNAINLAIRKEKSNQGLRASDTLAPADLAKVVADAVEGQLSADPTVQRAMLLKAKEAAEGLGGAKGAVIDALQGVAADTFGDPNITFGQMKELFDGPGDKARLAALMAATAGDATPEEKAARDRMNFLTSPYSDGSVDPSGHVAAGIEEAEDDLLRLYLSRLQDKDTPGVVTPEEFEAEPRLAAAEQVYNDVKARNSYLKSAAEWYSDEYLSALRTKDRLTKQAAVEPFDGLDPYRWAQKKALERGGYTEESLLELDARINRPDVAPLVRPAFTRLRAEGGLAPKTEIEKLVEAAFKNKPTLTAAELESVLRDKRREERQGGRQAATQATGAAGRREARAQGRESARDFLGSPENIEAAKVYLLAMKYAQSGITPDPKAGDEVKTKVSKADLLPTPASTAAADAAAAAAARAAAQAGPTGAPAPAPAPTPAPPAPTPQEPPTGEEGVVELPPQKLDLTEGEAPTVEDLEEEVVGRTGFTTDPTNPDYKYRLMPDGNYAVLYKGLPTTTAKKGTRAHQSIASVLRGGAPLPASRPKQTTPAAPAAAAPAAAPAAERPMLGSEPAPPAPASAAPAAAPAPPPKVVPPMSEAAQLRGFIKDGTIKPGTPQYQAVLRRVAELESE